jgi:predicted nucleotide-binding protein
MDRLEAAGLDVYDFKLPADSIDAEGEVFYTVIGPRVAGSLSYIQRQIDKLSPQIVGSHSTAPASPVPQIENGVFIVHGQDQDALDTIKVLLLETGLKPLQFPDIRRLAGKPLPYIGEVLDAAFGYARAVLVLFTPDERVELKHVLWRGKPITLEFQPRPNVLVEAGLALKSHPDRTVIVEMGSVRPISDLAGRHTARWAEDTPATKSELLERLEQAGCTPKLSGSDWLEVGKKADPTWAEN